MQKKSCSNCNTQVHVACRNCPSCKQSFPKTGPIALIMSEYEGLFRRRTERIRREKPNYYDASEFSQKKNVAPTKKTNSKKSDKSSSDKDDTVKKSSIISSSTVTSSQKRDRESRPTASLPPPPVQQPPPEKEDKTDQESKSPVRNRRKKLMKVRVSKDTEEETYNSIMNTPQSAQQCGAILAELNRKMIATSWRGI